MVSKRQEISQLIMLLGSAIGAAILLSVFMIFYYGPSGQYYVKNILLSPEMTNLLDFKEGKHESNFKLDRIAFRYYDDDTKTWKNITLDKPTYEALYAVIENESSVSDVTPEMIAELNAPNPATLTLYVKNDKTTKVFQEVVFEKDGDLYRVLLRSDTPEAKWAYFHHRKIYDHVLHTIIPDGSNE